VQRKEAPRPQALAPASNHLLDRGPDRKLTRGWVKIVVDIGTRALLTAIAESMFVCFEVYSESDRATQPFLVPTYYWVTESLILMFQNRSNKHSNGIYVVTENSVFAAGDFTVAPAYRHSSPPPQVDAR
jgi:hypothetical protein